jgi:colanic acid biosynthesis glycosyl transferase WcaI
MKRVIFLNRFFFPDHSATSQIVSDLAFHLAGSGTETHVVTSRQLYDEPHARLPREETVRDVHIHRVSTSRFGRSTLWGRSIDYLSYYSSTSRSLLALARRDDIVVAMTDPPLISIPAMRAVRRREAHLVNWLQDVYPEVAIQLNVTLLKSPIGRALSILRDRSLQAAKANVVVGNQMATRILSRNMDLHRVHVIPNWVDDAEISPLPPSDNPLRRQWELEDKFVVGYSGNLGRPHEFNTILAASILLKDHPGIIFLCIGGGHSFDSLARSVEKFGLRRLFRFFPYQNQSLLKYSLGVADVHWISLKPQLEGLILPSKFYVQLLQRMAKSPSSSSSTRVASSSRQGMRRRLLTHLSIFQPTPHVLPRWVSVREPCWRLIFRDDRPLNAGVGCSRRSDDLCIRTARQRR